MPLSCRAFADNRLWIDVDGPTRAISLSPALKRALGHPRRIRTARAVAEAGLLFLATDRAEGLPDESQRAPELLADAGFDPGGRHIFDVCRSVEAGCCIFAY